MCGLRSKDRRAGQVHDHVEVVNPCLDSEGADQLTGGQHVALRLDVVLTTAAVAALTTAVLSQVHLRS